jgi:hypothetical protein
VVSPFALVNSYMEFCVMFYEKKFALIWKKQKDLQDI